MVHPGLAPGLPRPRPEIGRVGHHQVEPVPRQQGPVPQVPGEDLPGQAVVRQVLPGQGGGAGVQLDAHPVQLLLPLGEEEQQGAHPAAQVAHRPALPQGSKPGQQHAVPPQFEVVVGLGEAVGPQVLHRGHGCFRAGGRPSMVRSWFSSHRTVRAVMPQI